MRTFKLFVGFMLVVLWISCNPNETYFNYRHVPTSGWHKDTLLTFDYNIQDTLARYNIFVHVRHYGNYPYQNIWLFMENTNVNGIAEKDTIECYLADQYGKWLGAGNAVKEIPVFYRRQILLPDSGNYRLTVAHGMRDTVLVGIKSIGIRVEKAK